MAGRLTSSEGSQVKTTIVKDAAARNPQEGLQLLSEVFAGAPVDQSEASMRELAECAPARPLADCCARVRALACSLAPAERAGRCGTRLSWALRAG